MALKTREGFVPAPVLSPQEQIRSKLERTNPIRTTDDLKRWLMVGNYAIAPDRIERIMITSEKDIALRLSDGAILTVNVPADLSAEHLVRAIISEEISSLPFSTEFDPAKEG